MRKEGAEIRQRSKQGTNLRIGVPEAIPQYLDTGFWGDDLNKLYL
jgi:hypothetical protein